MNRRIYSYTLVEILALVICTFVTGALTAHALLLCEDTKNCETLYPTEAAYYDALTKAR